MPKSAKCKHVLRAMIYSNHKSRFSVVQERATTWSNTTPKSYFVATSFVEANKIIFLLYQFMLMDVSVLHFVILPWCFFKHGCSARKLGEVIKPLDAIKTVSDKSVVAVAGTQL
jgi:hypothetical protein